MRSIPRPVGVLGWVLLFSLVYGAAPVAVSRFGKRHGWRGGRPGAANLVGLIPLSAGAGVVAWTAAMHYREAEGGWSVAGKRLGQPPDYLLTGGPYGYTRNPMHLGSGAIWLGWSVLLGSPTVAAVLGAGGTVAATLVPHWEEAELEHRFGNEWKAYERDVPRWFPRPRTRR